MKVDMMISHAWDVRCIFLLAAVLIYSGLLCLSYDNNEP